MKSAFLVSFDTDREVTVDERFAIKEAFGDAVRVSLNATAQKYLAMGHPYENVAWLAADDADVAVDHLDPSEPTVSALVNYQSGAA